MSKVKRFSASAFVFFVAALNVAIVVATSQREADLFRSAALYAFEERVSEYAALHRRIEAPLPLKPTDTPYISMVKRRYLASAIKKARPTAKQGDIFAPNVERLFRELIAEALNGRDAEAILRDLFEDHPAPSGFRPGVYDSYPDWATHQMPVVLLQWLPPLPEELEYRRLGPDLVLWDAQADLIVDVLPSAFRPSTQS